VQEYNINYSAFGKSLLTYKRCWKLCPQTIVNKNWIKQPVLHFNRRLTTAYSETTAHFNGIFDAVNQTYVP
jgi:adenylate cyclase